MRETFVYDPERDRVVPRSEAAPRSRGGGLQIIRDIDPYRSIVTGEVISGRRQHREHLRKHDLVEVGNENPRPQQQKPMPSAAKDLRQTMRERGLVG